ncbi:MAG: ribbon-helix-helix protein, CopG family [Deltaproteobacteria bacterium]|nr:ribbon-helix-helix protein, CopG family [Deltaproteobacteria bacterium]
MQTMTLKISDTLLEQVGLLAEEKGLSKSEIVRQAIAKLFKGKKSKQSDWERIELATKAHFHNKKIKNTMTLEDFRKKLKGIKTTMSPEEEVLFYRRRGL